MLVLGGIFLILCGFLMVFYPEEIYEFSESWKSSSSSSPSHLYILTLRIGGGLFLLCGIAGIILNFVF